MEQPLLFPNARNQTLVGVFHPAQSEARGALLLLHGWSGYRTGPHAMLAHAARFFGPLGWASLRFDFAGRGDADGDYDATTLATMSEDVKAALQILREKSEGPIWLVGLCSGCEVAVASASDEFAGALLWSAPIFAPLPENAGAAQKRTENLRRYAKKLLQISTYRKIWKREIDTRGVSKAMSGQGGAASKNVESNEIGQLPPGFRRAALERWKRFEKPVFQVYGGADPIFPPARAWYEQNSAVPPQLHVIQNANHSFYGLNWEREVFEATREFLRSIES